MITTMAWLTSYRSSKAGDKAVYRLGLECVINGGVKVSRSLQCGGDPHLFLQDELPFFRLCVVLELLIAYIQLPFHIPGEKKIVDQPTERTVRRFEME